MDFKYVFGAEWFDVFVDDAKMSRCTCEMFRTFWSEISQHERFSSLLLEAFKGFAREEGDDDDVSSDCREDSTYFVMKNSLYCRVLPQLQGIIMRCVKEEA